MAHTASLSRYKARHLFRQAVVYLTVLVSTVVSSVGLAAGNQPLEYLDEETGATVTAVGRPLVFVHDRSGFLGPAGDYVTLAAAAVNQSGKITYVLIAYFWWSGVPPKSALTPPAVNPLALQADDRGIQLVLLGATAREVGIGRPVHQPRLGAATPYIYAIDLSTMRMIAESRQLALHIESEGSSVSYELIEDRRMALKEFVRSMNRNE